MRKPIQIAYLPPFDAPHLTVLDQLVALCDDGTLWIMNAPRDGGEWERLAGVPQEDECEKEPTCCR